MLRRARPHLPLAALAPSQTGHERSSGLLETRGFRAERLFYGFSITCCLPDGMSHPHSAGTGTVFRPRTLERYASEAGYSSVEVLPIEDEMFRFYRLHP